MASNSNFVLNSLYEGYSSYLTVVTNVIVITVFLDSFSVENDDRFWREGNVEHSTQVMDLVDFVAAGDGYFTKIKQRQKWFDRAFLNILIFLNNLILSSEQITASLKLTRLNILENKNWTQFP